VQNDLEGFVLMKNTLLLMSVFALSICIPRDVEAREVMSLATVENFKPFRWYQGKKLKGIDIDVLSELGNRTDIQFEILTVPWARLLSMVKYGRVDGAFAVNKTKEREAFAYFLDTPLHQGFYSAFVLKGHEFLFNDIEDLYGKKIAKIRKYHISDEFELSENDKKFKVFLVNKPKQYIDMLKLGRIDAFVGQYYATQYEIQQSELSELITTLPRPVSNVKNAYLVISKKSSNKHLNALIQRMNLALKEMLSDGSFEKINAAYVKDARKYGVNRY